MAYITHARTLAETLPEGALGETVRWSSFFVRRSCFPPFALADPPISQATEAVRSSHANGPILFSKTDQRLLHGDDIESLEQLEKSLIDDKRKHTPDPNQVFGSMRSCESAEKSLSSSTRWLMLSSTDGYHVIEVARTLDENACGSESIAHLQSSELTCPSQASRNDDLSPNQPSPRASTPSHVFRPSTRFSRSASPSCDLRPPTASSPTPSSSKTDPRTPRTRRISLWVAALLLVHFSLIRYPL